MRALFTAIVAAVEAAAVALVGLLIVVIPALLLWMITFDLAAEPLAVFGGVVAGWLLAHFVPLDFALSSQAATALGLPQQAIEFQVTLAPLGLTLVTVAFAVRAGWRFGQRGGAGAGGVLGGVLGFGVVAAFAAPFAAAFTASRPLWLIVATAASVYGSGVAAGFLARAAREGHTWLRASTRGVQLGIQKLGLPGVAAFPSRAAATVSLTFASLAALIGLAALGVAVALVVGYVQSATVSQVLQLDALGTILLFIVQLALLPIAGIWAMSWFSGTGFFVGEGTSVTPFETLTGPLPNLPLFAAIPDAWGTFGAFAPALVVLCGVLVGALFARKLPLRDARWSVLVIVPMLSAALTGLACAGLGTAASGAIGPDRLAASGVHGWVFGALVAAEVAGGLLLGVASSKLDTARLGRLTSPESLRGVAAALKPSARKTAGAAVPLTPSADPDRQHPDGQDTEPLDYPSDPQPEEIPPESHETVEAVDTEVDDIATETNDTDASDSGSSHTEPQPIVDELVESFSWDRYEPDPDPSAAQADAKRRGWRWPGRKG